MSTPPPPPLEDEMKEEYENCMKNNSSIKYSVMASLSSIPLSVYFSLSFILLNLCLENYKPLYLGLVLGPFFDFYTFYLTFKPL
jgi:hypothetical protein